MIEKDVDLYNKLRDVRHALTNLAIKPELARRRWYSGRKDVDEYIGPTCNQYILDLYKLQQSKAMRRLANKTQVFPDPKTNRHIRTRLIHTLEVASIAGIIAEILGLDVQLTQAIAQGHDIGHAPFGHLGEEFISTITGQEFRHEIFACVVAQHIERQTHGLNLTLPTLLGIRAHSRGKGKMSLSLVTIKDGGEETVIYEADIVMYADKIAYCFSDISDIFDRGYKNIDDFPQIKELVEWFGPYQRIRTGRCIAALCVESAEKGFVSFTESEEAKNFEALKMAMYSVYPLLNRHRIITPMLENVYEIVAEKVPNVNPAILLALMTDNEVFTLHQTEPRDTSRIIETFSVSEIIPFIRNKTIDFTNPDLDW